MRGGWGQGLQADFNINSFGGEKETDRKEVAPLGRVSATVMMDDPARLNNSSPSSPHGVKATLLAALGIKKINKHLHPTPSIDLWIIMNQLLLSIF